MTVAISGTVSDITGSPDNRPWRVWAVEYEDGDPGVITTRHSRAVYPIAGTLTLTVEPDVAVVIETPDGQQYFVTTPTSNADLWDVIGEGS